MADLLVLKYGKHSWLLYEGEHTVGRSLANSVSIDEKGVSRKHCKIQVTDSEAVIEDLGSRFGTFVNNELIRQKTLGQGDKIKIGDAMFEIGSPDEDGSEEALTPEPVPGTGVPESGDPTETIQPDSAPGEISFCPSCGLPNMSGDQTCFNCGEDLAE